MNTMSSTSLGVLLSIFVFITPLNAAVKNRSPQDRVAVSKAVLRDHSVSDVQVGEKIEAARSLSEETPCEAGAPSYTLRRFSVNSGGEIRDSSSSYRMGLSIGQTVAAVCSTSSYHAGLGFWHGAPERPCVCTCHADPKCDGVTNVYDVVFAVGVAFRNEVDILDSSATCPSMTTDVDCDGVTKIFDIVKLINVAFRGADPATEFCEPCGM